MRRIRLLTSMLALAVLSGCAGMGLQKAQDMTPQGSAFNTNLYEGYVDLSASEFAEADYEDSDAFAERAISAGSDKLVRPEQIDQRALPDDKVGELKDARRRLTMALSTGAAEQHPAVAANAQVMFDCWMQEQEENFQPKDIARCRGATLAALDKLEVKPVAEAPAPIPKATPATAPMAPETFIVYFAFDSTEMTAEQTCARQRHAGGEEDGRQGLGGHRPRRPGWARGVQSRPVAQAGERRARRAGGPWGGSRQGKPGRARRGRAASSNRGRGSRTGQPPGRDHRAAVSQAHRS